MLIFRPDWHEKKVFCYMAILPHVLFYFFFGQNVLFYLSSSSLLLGPMRKKKGTKEEPNFSGIGIWRGALCCSFTHVRSKQSHPTNDMLPRLWSPSIEKQTRIEPFSFYKGQFLFAIALSFCLFLSLCFFWFWDI